MSGRILFVDDEPNVLQALERQLRGRFPVATATGGAEGLAALREKGPFAVVVSDMRMPGMDGPTFLRHVRSEFPDVVQMILSGQADFDATIQAVNEGNVFRFLTKPCPGEVLTRGLNAALEQYRLLTSEKELLERTLSGSIQMLTEVLELAHPEAFSRSARIRAYADALGNALHAPNAWQLRLAAMLSQLGCIALPGDALSRIRSGGTASEDERVMFKDHPRIAGRLLAKIPRLEGVSRIVAAQDGRAAADPRMSPDEKWSADILRTVVTLVDALEQGRSVGDAVAIAEEGAPRDVAEALRSIDVQSASVVSNLPVEKLRIGMILDQDVLSRAGLLLARRGQTVSDTMLFRLLNFSRGAGVVEPIRALVPARDRAHAPA